MEEKFYLDDFELTLQEQANQFKMVPSKRVWHGIYNDLHPGRRWPSGVMSLLLILSIVFIGYVNNHTDKNPVDIASHIPVTNNGNDISGQRNKNGKKELSVKPVIDQKSNRDAYQEQTNSNTKPISFKNVKEPVIPVDNLLSDKETNKTNSAYSPKLSGAIKTGASLPANVGKDLETYSLRTKENSLTAVKISEENFTTDNRFETIRNEPDISLYARGVKTSQGQNTSGTLYINAPELITVNSTPIVAIEMAALDQNNSKNSIPENNNTALAVAKKKNDKISWVYYAAPFVSSVSFSGVQLKGNTNSNLSSSPLPQVTQKDMKVIRNAALGFEAGVQMNYSFATNLQFTAGVHVTRSGYNIVSNLVHPTLATLTLRNTSTGDTYSRNFVTHYGDGTGKSTVTLHNYSYQASIPVGVQYLIWDNDNFQVNLAADFEPSLVFKADAYLLSADGKNYVNVPDLLRKVNFSSNFAPFVSFRSSKFKWNIGPDIRYQWLSTYQNSYTVKEHLINYGIRVGISK